MRQLPAYHRAEVLRHCVKRFEERRDELAYSLCIEAGKPIRDSRGEVTRLIDTFNLAAEEATRLGGETMTLEISPRAKGYQALTKRLPKGVLSFITPFNFPLNLIAHKVAPAIAVGAPFVLKPAEKTPVGALLIGEILAETDLPVGAFSILPAMPDQAGPLTDDRRLKMLSFTGSDAVGWMLKERAKYMPVTLELGGNAACIVDETADLKDAANRITLGAFYQSGQSCISVQRVVAHESILDKLTKLLIERADNLKTGDPREEETDLGPLINEEAAHRIDSWINSAVQTGAEVLCGGERNGRMMQATWLANVNRSEDLYRREVFGPVAMIEGYSDFSEALEKVNDSDYGLQAGLFTRYIDRTHMAFEQLEVGGLMVNDIPSYRVDSMPYGGVKDSGIGREGIRYAMEEMTDLRLMVLRDFGI
jgi:acyl-CoA reductase-like NAD-dependent aldehyde dehydrogenase